MHALSSGQSRDRYSISRVDREEKMDEHRVKTFIALTRQALEEDRVGQQDLFYYREPTMGYTRPDKKRVKEGLKKKTNPYPCVKRCDTARE